MFLATPEAVEFTAVNVKKDVQEKFLNALLYDLLGG